MARSTVNIITQLAPEPQPGTLTAATKRLPGLEVSQFSPVLGTKFYRPSSGKYNQVGVLNQLSSKGTFKGPLSFQEWTYLMAGYVGSAAPSSLGSGAFQWTFAPSLTGLDLIQTYSIERGELTGAGQKVPYCIFDSISVAITRTTADCSGTIFGQNITDSVSMTGDNAIQSISITGSPTGGTFTLTFGGQTTSALAYNATAAQVQAALLALSSIGAGNVTVTGGALPANTLTVTFVGSDANAAEATINHTDSLTGGSSPAVAITVVTTGSAAPTVLAQQPVSAAQINFYMDTSYGAIGTTQITDPFTFDLTLPSKFKPNWVLNTTYPSYKSHVEQYTQPSCKLLVEYNAQMRAIYATASAASLPTYYLRSQAIGAAIGGGNNYAWTFDCAAKLKTATEKSDQDGVYAYEFEFEIVGDTGIGGPFKNTLVNTLASL